MSERLRESLSALMDDEANELEIERVLSQVTSNTELRERWSRYQVASTALGGQTQSLLQMDISERVREAIAEEDDAAAARPRESLRERITRPLTSLAVAATVTATVVLGGQQLALIGSGEPLEEGTRVAASPSNVGMLNAFGGASVQASLGNESIPVLLPATRQAYDELAQRQMRKLMQEHAEQAALNSPQGLIPYSRVPQIRD
jgi:sigma-E factor negative regulatory protein RseA